MRIDLHTHSTASDGTDAPGEVVRLAAAQRLDVLGLTDHDSADGWLEAVAAAERFGVTLIRGMEISTKHAGEGVHLLAYLLDQTYEPLVSELTHILRARDDRLSVILDKLHRAGHELTEDDVRRRVGDSLAVGRPHIADAMVARGIVSHRNEAFETWLNPGRPGFVNRYAPPTETMIELVTAAGGAAVIAHPWRRGRKVDGHTLAGFARAGLVGIEVDHQMHDPEARAELHRLAVEIGLIATGSSDYHGWGKRDHELGCNLTSVEAYQELLDRAGANARAAARAVPEVVGRSAASAGHPDPG